MLDFLQELIRQQIESLSDTVRFVFIQPAYNAQSPLLKLFLNEPKSIYVSFAADVVGLEALQEGLNLALAEQLPASQWSDIRILIIDQIDLIQDEALETVLSDLVQYPNLRVLMLGRAIPAFVTGDTSLRSYIQVIPHESTLMFADYMAVKGGNVLLEVRALGRGHVLLNGKPITDWDGELPHDLFFFLVDKGMTTRDQIFETFWPDLPQNEATNVFHVTKRKINEVLGVDLTQYAAGFYRIAPEIDLLYDVSLFTGMLQQAAVESKAAAQKFLKHAIWLYRGEFLGSAQSPTLAWADRRRVELGQQYGEALMQQGRIFDAAGKQPEALGYYIRASVYNRQREDLAGLIMGIYRDLGMPHDALATYERVEKEIANTLGISPAQWLQDLAVNIRTTAKIETPAPK
ncbi:MAG: bacterial transcriptional activator domain-containing protein [Chloroflexi bacterium]|nr:bacterial transcriptional activator domain-containing protein [Chloroflexota bacterium]MCC6892011.1 bacterial transcriptional activator domain-containing protein [Anaerolineae bacterium]